MPKKRALLLGGTGAIGVYVAPALEKAGFAVDITSRQPRKDAPSSSTYIQGDAQDITFLENILTAKKYDVIIDFMVYSTEAFTQRMPLFLDSTDHYVFLSSYRVFAEAEMLTERSPRLLDVSQDQEFLKTQDYSLEKARQEDVLRESGRKNWTIVRPSITYSKNRFQLGTMEADVVVRRALDRKPVVLPAAMLDRQTTMTWAGDVATMMTALVLNKRASGEDFNLVTSEHVSWKTVAAIYEAVIGLRLKTTTLDRYIEIMGGGLARYQVKYDRMFNRVCDNSKILETTGLKQADFVSLRAGLTKELKDFVEHPVFSSVDESIQLRMDSETEGLVVKMRKGLKVRTRVKGALKLIKHKTRLRTRYRDLKDRSAQAKRDRVEAGYYDGAIVTLPGNYNYGNLVQKYALQTFLGANGLKFRIIDTIRVNEDQNSRVYGHLQAFFDNILDTLPFEQAKRVSYRCYIVGSDQVWRNWYAGAQQLFYHFFFDFVRAARAKKISYAASFGVDNLKDAGYSESVAAAVTPLIRDFSALSVREGSAVSLVHELTGDNREVRVVVDPTLLLGAEDYSKLIDTSAVKHDKIPKLFAYVLDRQAAKEALVRRIAEKYDGDRLVLSPRDDHQNEPVELWLKGFRDADFIVTDSFHGTVFSIINNKPFIVFANKSRGLSRMENLLHELGIAKDRLVFEEQIETFDETALKEIDWKKVNDRLDVLKQASGAWLLDAIADRRGDD